VNFDLTDDQRMLKEGAARYFEKSYDFKQRLQRARSEGGFSRAVWQEMAEMGWLAAGIAEDHGGLGFGPVEITLIAEECGRHLVLEPFTACGVLPAAIITHVAHDEQKSERLQAIAAGERLYAVACSEPDARGDLAQVACRATRVADGTWRLSGRKSLVVGAPIADRLLIVARSRGEVGEIAGLAVFDANTETRGCRLERYALVDGTPAADLVLEDVQLPAETLLGPYGQAGDGLQRALDEAIVAQCAETVGGCEDVLALCSEYLKTRKQFGVPIGSFQALQHRMADMAIETSQARASLHRGLEALATASAERRSVDVSGVKAQVLKSARFVTQQGIQLHGGYGITEEYRVGHHWRRLLLTDTVFGSQAHHLDRYARRIQFDATAAFAAYDRRA
jgi:alkylation response protein AidB-like acyl-CoA dehydrogenase